jgi:hypothetical protein
MGICVYLFMYICMCVRACCVNVCVHVSIHSCIMCVCVKVKTNYFSEQVVCILIVLGIHGSWPGRLEILIFES